MTRTSVQRYNSRMDKIWETYLKQEAAKTPAQKLADELCKKINNLNFPNGSAKYPYQETLEEVIKILQSRV